MSSTLRWVTTLCDTCANIVASFPTAQRETAAAHLATLHRAKGAHL